MTNETASVPIQSAPVSSAAAQFRTTRDIVRHCCAAMQEAADLDDEDHSDDGFLDRRGDREDVADAVAVREFGIDKGERVDG